ncbi:MAG: hypothetical protein V7K27_21665 [Nostoc sp.]
MNSFLAFFLYVGDKYVWVFGYLGDRSQCLAPKTHKYLLPPDG